VYNQSLHQLVTTPTALFSGLFVLTALTAGQLYVTTTLLMTLAEAPSQTTQATVS
jgi:hypothetical protein